MTDETNDAEDEGLLVSRQKYLASGMHIGMKQKTEKMKRFIYKIRPDGLAVLNIQLINDRLKTAAEFISKYENIAIVSRKEIGQKAVSKFAEITGTHAVVGRFMPGTLTNPDYRDYYEADVLIVIDPIYDYQAIKEASTARIPVVALCGTSNITNNLDFIIPVNNKSMKSIATSLWILSRELLKEQGKIKNDDEFEHDDKEFMEKSYMNRSESRGRGRKRRSR